jgi:DNA-binding NarL/FixJ family response regulator
VRVIVQERRRLVRAGIARLLAEDRRGVEVVGVAADESDVVALVGIHRAELLVLELEPQGWDLAGLIAWLRADHPRCRIVALHHGRRADHEAMAEQLGIGLVSYSAGVAGLRAAMRGRVLPVPADAVPDRRRLPSRAAFSVGEREMLRRMAAGDTAEEAAIALSLSPRTVELAQRRILDKLGARGRAHAVAVAHQIGVLGAA